MHRTLVPLLLLLLVLAARPVSAEDDDRQEDALDPAVVARLLLSSDEAERARGVGMLRERLTRGGDVQTWLVAMARAQAAWADDESRLTERWIEDVLHGAPERAERARRLIAALGREATRRLLRVMEVLREKATLDGAKEAPAAGVPQAPQAPPAQPGPALEGRPEPEPPVEAVVPPPDLPPVARLVATVVEVPSAEILRRYAADAGSQADAAPDLRALEHDEAVVLRADARAYLERATTIPEARTRRMGPDELVAPGRPVVIAPGDSLRYRSRTKKTKGAWAVATDTLARGLQVSFVLEPEGQEGVALVEARYVRVPDPLPTEQVRPAEDVEPIELDRPEWESASMQVKTRLAVGGDEIVAFFPGLVPDKVVVVGLRLLPLVPPQAAAVPK